jgi:hypothetical protein
VKRAVVRFVTESGAAVIVVTGGVSMMLIA